MGSPLLKGYFFFLPFLSGAWVSAEPATDFTFLGVLGFCRSLPAFEATLLEVFSFFAIDVSPMDKGLLVMWQSGGPVIRLPRHSL